MTSSSTQPKPMASNVDDAVTKRIRIRSYEPSGHQAVLDIYVPGLMSYADVPGQSRPFWQAYLDHSLTDDMANIYGVYFAPGGHFWVAVVVKESGDEEVVGIVGLERTAQGEGELRRMSVKPAYRRYGVGRMLVEALESWARDNGFTRVSLSAGYVLEKAHRFYEALGYTKYKDEVYHEHPLFIMGHFEKRL